MTLNAGKYKGQATASAKASVSTKPMFLDSIEPFNENKRLGTVIFNFIAVFFNQ